MPLFQYNAIALDGQRENGSLDAASLEVAREALVARGLQSIELRAADAGTVDANLAGAIVTDAAQQMPAVTSASLSASEAQQLTEHLATITHAGLPLAPALRAASGEFASRRLSVALNDLAQQIESGKSLEKALVARPQLLPQHLRRLIEGGARAGKLPEVLLETMDLERTSYDLWREVRLAIGYPALLLALLVAILVLAQVFITPAFTRMFHDFRIDLPAFTQFMLYFSGMSLLKMLGVVLAIVFICWILLRLVFPATLRSRMGFWIPLVGPALHWQAVARWSRLSGLLVRHGAPAQEAMRMAADGTRNAYVAAEGRRVAECVELGNGLAESIEGAHGLPASLVPVIRWGETNGALADAFDTAGDMFENQVRLRASLMQIVLPPLSFVMVAMGVGAFLLAMMSPLMSLITNLSGSGTKRGRSAGLVGPPNEIDVMLIAQTVGLSLAILAIMMATALWLMGRFQVELSRKLEPYTIALLGLGMWCFIALALLINAFIWAFIPGLVFATGIVVIAMMVASRNRESQQRALAYMIGTAVEKDIPLEDAVWAFAKDCRGWQCLRCVVLAELLHHGVALDRAMAFSGNRLPTDALVAVRMGTARGDLKHYMKNLTARRTYIDHVLNACITSTIYIMLLVVVVGFTTYAVFPAFAKMMKDYKIEPSPIFQAFALLSRGTIYSQLLAVVYVLMALAVLYMVARYIGIPLWDPPLIRRLWQPLDQAIVLRSLALAVDGQQTVPETIDKLAEVYPKSHVRRQLAYAGAPARQGTPWWQALERAKLLHASDGDVLSTAQKVGNLSWALRHTADRRVRQFIMRINTVMAIGFPLLVLAFGSIMLLFAVAVLGWLANLILHLS